MLPLPLPLLRSRRLLAAALALPLGLPLAATAQSAPPGIGDALRQVQPAPAPPPVAPAVPLIEIDERRPLRLPEGATLKVDRVTIDGAPDLDDDDEPRRIVAALEGQAPTLPEIENVADALTALYQRRGYLLARTYVPRQDARDGTLHLRVLPGRLGRITVRNRSWVQDPIVTAPFEPLRDAPALARGDLEQAMLVVADFPGAALPTLNLGPGAGQGLTDLELAVPSGTRGSLSLIGDNWGSRYTGEHRWTLDGQLNSPFGRGDQLALRALGSDGGGLLNGRLGYGTLLQAANGMRVDAGVAHTVYELGDRYRPLGATGVADTADASLALPLLRRRDQTWTATATLAWKRLRDHIALSDTTTPKRARVLTLGLQHERWAGWLGRGATATVSASVSAGRLWIADEARRNDDAKGARTNGDWTRANLGGTLQWELPRALTVSTTLSVQQVLTSHSLDASEQLTIAGTSGVRAYRESVSGDSGVLWSTELRQGLPAVPGLVGYGHTVSAFVDLARIGPQDAAGSGAQPSRLTDLGLGYAARYRAGFGKLQYARAFGPIPDGLPRGPSRGRLLLQAGLGF